MLSVLANSLGLKSVFEKPIFRDGYVWMIGRTVGRKLRIQISPAWYGRSLTVALSSLNWNIVGATNRILTTKGRRKMQQRTSHLLRAAKLLFT